MKKNKQKGFGISLQYLPYPFDLYVSFGQSLDDVNKYIQKSIPEFNAHKELGDIGGVGHGRTLEFKSGQMMIYLPFIPVLTTPTDMALLQHEIFHAVHLHFERLGTPLIESTQEVYAYMIQYLTVEILDAIKTLDKLHKYAK
jgi:hypothetical protein